MIDWLKLYRWLWFIAGTFMRHVGCFTAMDVARTWLKPYPDAYAFVGLQQGPHTDGKIHVHALVGGTGPDHRVVATNLRRTWVKNGNVWVDAFTPTLPGVRYIVDQYEDYDILGQMMLYQPRKRGRVRRTAW